MATIAGLTAVASMAAPAMADETATDVPPEAVQSTDPVKDAKDGLAAADQNVKDAQNAADQAQSDVDKAQ